MNRQSLENPFIPAQIKHRKGNFNRTPAYVEAPTVIYRLNNSFDAAWSFEIIEHLILQDELLVLGRLTAEGIIKTQPSLYKNELDCRSPQRGEENGKHKAVPAVLQ